MEMGMDESRIRRMAAEIHHRLERAIWKPARVSLDDIAATSADSPRSEEVITPAEAVRAMQAVLEAIDAMKYALLGMVGAATALECDMDLLAKELRETQRKADDDMRSTAGQWLARRLGPWAVPARRWLPMWAARRMALSEWQRIQPPTLGQCRHCGAFQPLVGMGHMQILQSHRDRRYPILSGIVCPNVYEWDTVEGEFKDAAD